MPEAFEEAKIADRETKERKLTALMVNDLGEKEIARLEEEVRTLADAELDETLAARLDLPHSANKEALERALLHVKEPSRSNQESFTGAPNMSHEPRPEERERPSK
jgi:predicted ATPase